VYCKPVRIRGYIGFLDAPIFCVSRSAALLDSNTGDEQTVIKDSEAIRHVGRYVEVRGLVVSVTTSPLGTAFINFGRDYPNQIFAGFIPADSKMATDQRITTLQGKIIGIIGTIELREGKPEIRVMSMYQVIGLNSKLVE